MRLADSFLAELEQPRHEERQGSRLADALDAETRERLERLRRGDG